MTTAAARSIEVVQLGAATAPRSDLPGLDRVGAKVARGLTAFFAASGGSTRIDGVEVRVMTLGDWKAALPPAVAVARYRDRAIKGGLLLSVPPALVAALVDAYYGGDGVVDPVRVVFGAAEHRLFDRLAGGASEALTAAWADTLPLAPALVGTVYARDDIGLGKPGDMVVVQRFESGSGGQDGSIEIVYPLVALRGIPGLHGAVVAEAADEADPVWRTRLSDAVMQARLPVRTVIARPSVSLSRLMALAPGDFIPVTLPPRVPLTVAGRLLAHGTIGEANGRAAIMIDKLEHGACFDD